MTILMTAEKFLQENIEETNIPDGMYTCEIAEMMEWYYDYCIKEKETGFNGVELVTVKGHEEYLKVVSIDNSEERLLLAYQDGNHDFHANFSEIENKFRPCASTT